MLQLGKANTKMKCQQWTKKWNWTSCTMLALRASWTYGFIAQVFRVSERCSVVMGWNTIRANFLSLLLKILQWWIPYVSIHPPVYVITCARLRLKQIWWLLKAKTEMIHEHWTNRWNWRSCTKLSLGTSWTHGLIAQSVRASERDSVVLGLNPTQAKFL